MGGSSSSDSTKTTNVTTKTNTTVQSFTTGNDGFTFAVAPNITLASPPENKSKLRGDAASRSISANTSVTTGDIGLTGANAVALATVLQRGAIESDAIQSQSLRAIVQQSGASYQQLVGGANNLIYTAGDIGRESANIAARNIDTGETIFGALLQAGQNLISGAQNEADSIRDSSVSSAKNLRETAVAVGQGREPESQLEKAWPYIVGIAGIAIPVFLTYKGGNK